MSEKYTKDGIHIENMKTFMKFFEDEIIPVMKGEDGNGLAHFKEIARLRRKEVEDKKEYREEILAAKEEKNAI